MELKADNKKVGRGIIVTKTQVRAQKTVPVRVMNFNYYPVTLEKGTVLGWYWLVSTVVHRLEAKADTLRFQRNFRM